MSGVTFKLRYIAAGITLILASLLFYQAKENPLNIFFPLICFPFFIYFSLTILIWPITPFRCSINKYVAGLITYAGLIGLSYVLAHSYYKINNYSPIIISAFHGNDHKTYLYLRENGTYKIRYTHMLGEEVNYGKYKIIDDDKIIIKSLEIGACEIKDTLYIIKKSIHFEYESDCWREGKDKMLILDTNKEGYIG